MTDLFRQQISYNAFCQRVRRYAPSTLIPEIARLSAFCGHPGTASERLYKQLLPWALAEITRASLIYGNKHRSQPVTENDIKLCCAAHIEIYDPDVTAGTLEGLLRFMLRLANEQFPYNEPSTNEWSRSIALFEQTTSTRTLEVLTGDWAQHLLGCSVAEYVGISFFAHVGALQSQGRFDFRWLDQDNFSFLRETMGPDTIRKVLTEHFIASVEDFKSLQPDPQPHQHPNYRRYLFNPLLNRPIISGLTDHHIVPVVDLLVRKSSQLGIYHTGTSQPRPWAEAFTRDIGHLFEAYVGRHLALMHGVVVHPAITYGRDKRESVDWLAVFDDAVVLVEVKSARSTASIRAGDSSAGSDLKQRLNKAVRQVATTASLIESRHPAFNAIPNDRPVISLVVTLEPFYLMHTPKHRKYLDDCPIPLLFCSSRELEHLVTLTSTTMGTFLLSLTQKSEAQSASISTALQEGDHSTGSNAVIDAAWQALPWHPSRSLLPD